jgi:hypothetical protein
MKKIPGLERCTAKFYQTFGEKLTKMLLKLFHKIERKKWYPAHSMNPLISLISKADKNYTKRDNY